MTEDEIFDGLLAHDKDCDTWWDEDENQKIHIRMKIEKCMEKSKEEICLSFLKNELSLMRWVRRFEELSEEKKVCECELNRLRDELTQVRVDFNKVRVMQDAVQTFYFELKKRDNSFLKLGETSPLVASS